jgi:hypothetical protein
LNDLELIDGKLINLESSSTTGDTTADTSTNTSSTDESTSSDNVAIVTTT